MLFSEEYIPVLIASLAFVVICLLSTGIIVYARGVRYRREMLEKIHRPDGEWQVIEKVAPSLELSDGSTNAFVKFLGAIGLKVKPGKSADHSDIKLKFLRAGLRGRNVATVFWGTKVLLGIVFPIVFFMLTVFFFKTTNNLHILLGALFLASMGLLLPNFWLRFRTSQRKERLTKGFPDALDLMVVCVEAGMGLDAAISRVGQELGLSYPELSNELDLLNLELRAGKPRHTALKNLADRMDIDDVNSLVTLLVQTDRFGTSVAQALRVFSDSFRTARYQRAEEIAAKISTKLIFPLVLFIFPSMFIVMLGPVFVQVYRLFLKG